MQYKGFKRIKRAAAVILSAAMLVSELPQAGITYAAQEYEIDGQEESESEVSGIEAPETENQSDNQTSSESESRTAEQTPETETSKPEKSEAETIETESGATTEQATQTETETMEASGTENSETETTEIETTEIETIETEIETIEPETEEQTSISIPEVDTTIYEYESAKSPADTKSPLSVKSISALSLREDANGAYTINNKDEFMDFISSNADYSGKTVKLNGDINLNGECISFSAEFNGTFDGSGHSVENLRTGAGLFKSIGSSGKVQNLHISKAALDTATSASEAGILAGTNNGTITNVTVTGSLEASTAMSYSAGIAARNSSGAVIENSVFAGTLIAQTGITGTRRQGGITAQNSGVISECYTYGTLNSEVQACAGIAAENDGEIHGCANYMNITSSYNAAGIAANNRFKITDCENYGNIIQNDSSVEAAQIGGIAAENTASGTVSVVYNFAEIKSEKNNVGGILGVNNGVVSASGNIGAVSGNGNVGGVIGQNRTTREDNIVTNCFNTGSVSGTGSGTGIGGIVGAGGSNYIVNIESCYNRGSILATENTDGIGGIAGIIYKGSIKNCYNAGVVSEVQDKCVGNIAGLSTEEVTVADYYYLKNEKVAAVYYKKDDNTATAVIDSDRAKTAEELKTAAVGLGFIADNEGKNEGYPVINGQGGNQKRYLIVYDLNGGYSDSYYTIVSNGSKISEPQAPTKKNAEFKGWYTNESLTDAVVFDKAVSGAAVIYAKWDEKIQVTDFSFPQNEVTLVKDESFSIVVNYIPADAQNKELTWTSSDTSVATVDDNGKVKAVADVESGSEKEAVITARMKDGTLSKECTFNVKVTGKNSIVRIMTTEEPIIEIKDLDVAMNYPVTVEAVVGGNTTGTISWQSQNSKIAKVEYTGKLGKIIGVEPGRTTITAILDTGSTTDIISAKLDVTVRDKAEEIVISLGDDPVTDKKVFYDLVTRKFVAIDTKTGNRLEKPVDNLSARVLPSGAIQKVEWKSDNQSVIKFDDKNSGVVTPNSNGTATVTVSATDGTKVTAKTTVEALKVVQSLKLEPKEISSATPVIKDDQGKIILTAGSKIKLVPVYNPSDATNKKVAWSISPAGALSIDPETYEVTAGDTTKDTTVTVNARSLDLGTSGDGAECSIAFIIKPRVKTIQIYRAEDMKTPVNDKNIGVNPANEHERTINLKVKNQPENASQIVTWKSSDEDLAKITDNGDGSCKIEVANNKAGTAVITATAADGSGVNARTKINVTEKVSRIIIKGSKNVVKGGFITLTAEVEPKSVIDKTVTWSSLTPDTATVDAKGKVTGKSVGLAIIQATANDGSNTTEEVGIRVTEPIENFYIIKEGTEGSTIDGEYIIDKKDSLNSKKIGIDPDTDNNYKKLDIYVYPKDACQTVTWKSGNEKIATVNEDGTVTAIGIGTTTITATTDDGSGKNVKVTVNVTTLARGIEITGSHYVGAEKTIQLKAQVENKDAVNKNVVWSSSDSDVIKVDSKGKISTGKGKVAGFSTIRAEAADGSGVYAEHKVYIMGKDDTVDITCLDGRFTVQKDKNQKKYIELDMSNKETEEIQLAADLTGGTNEAEEKLVEWSTSNNKVATVKGDVKDGKNVAIVTVYMEGTVVIKAKTADGYASQDACTIKVVNSNPVVRITGPNQVGRGKQVQLSAGRTAIEKWESSDTSVATVSAKGLVKAKKEGTVTITAYAKVGTNKDAYEVTVKAPVSKVDIAVNNIENIITRKKLGMDIIKGYNGNSDKVQLLSVVSGDDDSHVTWKSSKPAVASVDENGVVEAVKAGTATITATANDGSKRKAVVTIVVAKQVTQLTPTDVTINKDGAGEVRIAYNKTVQLKVGYKPMAATTKKATWTVDDADKNYVSVNKSNGNVKAKRYIDREDKPYATVYATANDSSGIKCEFHVYVSKPTSQVKIIRKEENEALDTVFAAKSTMGVDIDINGGSVMLDTEVTNTSDKVDTNQRVVWKSGNTKIAQVGSDGKLTGLSMGKTTLTATVQDGTKKQCKINVYVGTIIKELVKEEDLDKKISTLRKGDKLELSQWISARPITATQQTLTYKTSNKKVVTVSSKGKITVKGKGEATITATTTDGSNISVQIPVTIP